MKTFLLDANSIVLLTRDGWVLLDDDNTQLYTSGVAAYELGNAVWKDLHLYKNVSENEARILLAAYHETLLRLNIQRQEELAERLQVLENADRLGLSYYDSAYLTAAKRLAATLVTEDKSLQRAAKASNLPVCSVKEIV